MGKNVPKNKQKMIFTKKKKNTKFKNGTKIIQNYFGLAFFFNTALWSNPTKGADVSIFASTD